ncbi:MAG: hypothetical protein WA814_00260 [Candidatus Baltobacteraceae bacterium]
MSSILERRIVRCPYHLAQRYLADSVESAAASAEPSPLTLTLAVPGGELVKNVIVTFAPGVDPMHFDQPWRIHWRPQAGPYPEFDGELTVRADETYETARLELSGSYRPPGGAVGAAFDWAVGGRIAAATAQALLERLAEAMESRYAGDEKAKESSASS